MLTQACQEAEVAAGVTQSQQDASFDGEEDDETIQCSQKYQHWNDGVGTSLDRTDKDADDSESELSHLLEAISRHDNPAPSGNGNDTVGQLSNAISGLSDASNHLSSATDHLDNMLRNHSDITTNDQAQVTREKHSNMVVSQCSDGPLDLVNNNENDDVTIWSTASDNPTAAAASDACASDQQENSTDPCSAECEEDRNDPCPSAHDDPDAPSSPVPEPRERRQILENPVVLLTAPTGKAANLLGKRAQLPGVTIHRVVYSYYYHMASCRKAEREETPPPSWIFADVEALVVDECSLVGVRLFSVLLRCLLEQARLRKVVLLGDVNQLPSIEPGAFLSDMFDSLDRVGVSVLLTTNHRSEAALIVNNAAAIANQELPQIDPKRNFHQITIGAEDDRPRGGSQQEEDDMSCDRDRAVRCLLNGEFPGVSSDRTSQFVAFRRKDCEAINELCCLHYAKHATRTPHGRRDFRRNDKVCCTKNGDVHVEKGYTDYSSGVAVSEDFTVRLSNGEIFFIVDILQEQGAKDTKATEFFVLHDPDRSGTEMHYIKVKARELMRTCRLQHAWARTIHTYQGSEAACVVYMVGAPGGQNWQHVYTAVTRGRTQVVLITRTQHLHTCVRSLPLRRQTSLRSHLGDVVTRLDRATWPLCASQRGGTPARAWADTVKQQRRLLADSPSAWNTMRPGISGFQPASQNSQSGWNSQNSRGNSISHGVVRKLPFSNDTSEISSVFTNQASTSKNTRTFPKKNESSPMNRVSSSDGRSFSDWDDSLEETMLGFASQNHHETTTKGQSASSSAGCDRLYPDLGHLQAAESHPPHPPTSQGLTHGAPGDSPAPSSQMFKAGGFVASTQVASAPRLYPDIEAELAEIEDGGIDGQAGTLADRQTGPADGLSSSQGYPTNRQTNSYVTRQPGGDKDTRRLESATDSDAMRQSTCATDAMSTSIIEADVFSFGGGGDVKTEKCVLYNKLSDQTCLAKTKSVMNERAKTDPVDMDTGAYRTEEKASDTDIFSTPTENPSNRDFLSTPTEVFSTAPASTGSGDRHPAQSPLGPDSAVDRPVSTSSVSSPARHDNSRLYRMHRTKNSPVGATGHHGGKSGPVSTLHGPVSSFRGPVSSLRGPVSTAGSPKRASVDDIWASWEESPPPNKKVTNDDLMSPVRRKVSGISLRGDRK